MFVRFFPFFFRFGEIGNRYITNSKLNNLTGTKVHFSIDIHVPGQRAVECFITFLSSWSSLSRFPFFGNGKIQNIGPKMVSFRINCPHSDMLESLFAITQLDSNSVWIVQQTIRSLRQTPVFPELVYPLTQRTSTPRFGFYSSPRFCWI